MSDKTIRRCGNCAWAEVRTGKALSLDLRCMAVSSTYYKKVMNRGYFGCRVHFPGKPGSWRRLASQKSG